MGYKKEVCLKTIAYELNISINTVSRALRDCEDISEKTKNKVRQAAVKLGYLPNNLVYSINKSNTRSIALVINNIKNYYFTTMSEKLIYFLKKEGYLVEIISLYGNEFNSNVIKECIYSRVDGIISFVEPTSETLEIVKMNKIPFMMLGRKLTNKYCDYIYTDDYKGGTLAAKYLCSKKCKNFIYVNVKGSECSYRRFEGFNKTLENKKDVGFIKKINIETFERQIKNYAKSEDLGIFCYNDEHLYLVLDIMKKLKIDTSNIVFIGYDAIAVYNLGTIKIASINFAYDTIAMTTVIQLNKRIKDINIKNSSICFDVWLEE